MFSFFIFYFFGCTCSLWKFLGQGSNLSHSRDHARSLTTRLPGNSNTLCFSFAFSSPRETYLICSISSQIDTLRSAPFFFPFLFFLSFSFCLFLFTATPLAYDSSWTRVKLELQLQAYATAMATLDLSHICNLCCTLQKCWMLIPLSKARDQTLVLKDTTFGS